MNIKIKLAMVFIAFIMTGSVRSQIDSAAFSKLIGSDPIVEINLGPMMLSLLSSATEDEDEGDIANVLSSLKGINVTVFEIADSTNMKSLRSEIKNLSKNNIKLGYEKLAMVNEDDSLVYVFAKIDEEKLTNLNIFALDDDEELVLIEIKGNILMSQIGELMNHFDVDLELNALDLIKQTKN